MPMSPALIPIYGVAGFVLVILIWAISTANRFTKVKNHIKESWSDVDVALQRRHDLIPNLVETVKGYAAHEQKLFEQIAKEREQAQASRTDIAQHARDEAALGHSVGTLIARAEAYPELRASEHFLALQKELANTEDRIAAARRFYNANVRDYNTMIDSFPSSIIAAQKSAKHAPFFEASDPSVANVPFAGV
jgi:LemA protein